MENSAIEMDPKEFIKFYKVVSQIDPELKKALRKQIMIATKPIVEDVKQAALAIPGTREAGTGRKKRGETLGLRASLANAAKADFNGTGRGAVSHIRISTTKFMAASGRPRTLPYYVEGRRKRKWRHPVYGNKEKWVEQRPHPFLMVTVLKHKEEFINSVSKAVDDTFDLIDEKMKTID